MPARDRSRPMLASSSQARWLVAAAVACAFIGVVLKLGGSEAPPRRSATTSLRHVGADGSLPLPDGTGSESPAPDGAPDAAPRGARNVAAPGDGAFPTRLRPGFLPDASSATRADRAQGALERGRLRKARREALLRAKRAGRWAPTLPGADGKRVPRDVVEHGEQYLTDTPVEAAHLGETLGGWRGSVSFWLQPHWQEGNGTMRASSTSPTASSSS